MISNSLQGLKRAGFTELIGKVEGLQEGIHIARCTLILQSDIARFLFGFPAEYQQ
jgi:hypothetical protein